MPARSVLRLLRELEGLRTQFGGHEGARVEALLRALRHRHFPDVASLIRFHEVLLFLRAFPHRPGVVRLTQELLTDFAARVDRLRRAEAGMEDFDPLEVSGIAGTAMNDTLSFDVLRWLVRRLPGRVEIDWENYDEDRSLAATWPRFLPLLEEDGYVEADVPWRRWLEAAQGSRSASPGWLVERFERMPLSPQERAELYDSLRLPVCWKLGNSPVSRTRNWRRVARPLCHDAPLIVRSQVSLAAELTRPAPRFVRLSRQQGSAVIEKIREVMLVRYRELYGTTLGDPASVVRADVGRGVSIYLWGLPLERRLPLRAYLAGFTLKNGVPINYIEAIGLFEWMEVGFNTFYTFRGGETAWIYAQVLRCLRALAGTTCISVYPYQLGKENDEAIDSGAFWFYRKLGFRPGRPDLLRLVEREEARIAADPRHRTRPATLRKLAEGHVFYEAPGSEPGAWDTFSMRNLGFRINRRMAKEFGGDSDRIRRFSVVAVARALGVSFGRKPAREQAAFENFALVLALLPDLSAWTAQEKEDLLRIIRIKAAGRETQYLRLLQKHRRLRDSLLKVGS